MEKKSKVLIPTEKQAVDILKILESTHTVLSGAVRSGKTVTEYFVTPILIKKHYNDDIIICGKTLNTIERNIIRPLRKMYGDRHISRIIDKKELYIFGKLVYIIPFTDESSYEKLQGMSVGLAICDESVLMPESFFLMLQTRLDKEDSQDIHTCNPGSPNHYLKKWMDDKNVAGKYISHYTIYDNPHLSKDVVRKLENDFSRNETFKKRYIDGLWVNTDGLACYAFNREAHLIEMKDISLIALQNISDALIVGIDGANINDKTCCSPMLVDLNGNSKVFRRFVHNPKTSRKLTNIEQVQLIKKYLRDLDDEIHYNDMNVEKILVVDCAAADLILNLGYELGDEWLVVEFTKKDIKRTLEIMNNVFNANRVQIVSAYDYDYELKRPTTKDVLIDELETVRVVENKQGKQALLDEDENDCFDSLRYAIAYRYGREYLNEESE